MTIAQLPTTKRGWLTLVRELGIRPAKGRGQNFLLDAGIVNRIVGVAGVTAADTVVEIGPGLGILTRRLAETARRVIAIEIDRHLAAHIESSFAQAANVDVIRADAMTVDLAEIAGAAPVKVVANLPYSAAAAIAQRVLEADIPSSCPMRHPSWASISEARSSRWSTRAFGTSARTSRTL
jgi:16S rRNA (adenine1518-N6/adenine1519-N6)-dimethyltransferase